MKRKGPIAVSKKHKIYTKPKYTKKICIQNICFLDITLFFVFAR